MSTSRDSGDDRARPDFMVVVDAGELLVPGVAHDDMIGLLVDDDANDFDECDMILNAIAAVRADPDAKFARIYNATSLQIDGRGARMRYAGRWSTGNEWYEVAVDDLAAIFTRYRILLAAAEARDDG